MFVANRHVTPPSVTRPPAVPEGTCAIRHGYGRGYENRQSRSASGRLARRGCILGDVTRHGPGRRRVLRRGSGRGGGRSSSSPVVPGGPSASRGTAGAGQHGGGRPARRGRARPPDREQLRRSRGLLDLPAARIRPGPRAPIPVGVYLLHGGSDTVDFFVELGVRQALDGALASGAVGPMLLVLVDGGPTFTGDGSTATTFDRYLATGADPRRRSPVAHARRAQGPGRRWGVALGGRHALEFAAAHPSLVAAAGGHSTTIPRAPGALAAAKIPIYLDVGEDDGLYDDAALARHLRRLGADIRWHPAPGTHGRPYWSAHLPDYLAFYSDALDARDG